MAKTLDRYRLQVTLRQITPLVVAENETHFFLRSSELKPKLNAFLAQKLKRPIPPEWLIGGGLTDNESDDDFPHLDFGISHCDYYDEVSIDNTQQQGASNNRFMGATVFYWFPKPAALDRQSRLVNFTIKSKKTALLAVIKDLLPQFFVLQNFGRGQSKGFGQFVVEAINGDPNSLSKQKIRKILYDHYTIDEHNDYTIFNYSNLPQVEHQRRQSIPDFLIDSIYKKIKAGINHGAYHKSMHFQYFCQNAQLNNTDFRGWEKKAIKLWMIKNDQTLFDKHIKIDPHKRRTQRIPIVGRCDDEAPLNNFEPKNHLFIRALLGLPENYEFLLTGDQYLDQQPYSYDRVKIKVSSIKEEGIEQFPSTIQFKCFDEEAFLVPLSAASIFNRTFTLSGRVTFKGEIAPEVLDELQRNEKLNHAPALPIKTPEKFDLVHFFNFPLTIKTKDENGNPQSVTKKVYEHLNLSPVSR